MSLSKQQMLGAVGAGVFVLCAGGLGFMFYSAWTQRGEVEETLQGETDSFSRYNAAAVFPSKVSIASVKSNEASYVAWHESAVALASRGDKVFDENETPSVFKQRLQAEVHRMAALQGGVEGRIAAPTFLFGFEQFLGEGGVLPKDNKEVQRLAAQLDTISRVVDIFADAGVLEVKTIRRIAEETASEEEESSSKNKRNARKSAQDADDGGTKETCLKYAFEFTTRPAALVTVLNQLTASERFFTVRNLSFRQSADTIVERLGAIESATTQNAPGGRAQSATRRRGRRGAAAAVDAKTGAVKIDPLVVDPELDAPILVSFTLEVRDFGRATAGVAPTADQPVVVKSDEKKSTEQKEGKE